MRHDLINLMRQDNSQKIKLSDIDPGDLARAVRVVNSESRGYKDCATRELAEDLNVRFNTLKGYIRKQSGVEQ